MNKVPRISKACNYCKFEFEKRIKSTKNFCSRACANKGKPYPPNAGRFKKGQKSWNAGKPLPAWMKKKLSTARMKSKYRTGEGHPQWKGGCETYFRRVARNIMAKSDRKKECKICLTQIDVEVHHKDGNYKNNWIKNLIYMCSSCHHKTHWKEEPQIKLKCPQCGNIFICKRLKRKYCSKRCYRINWIKRERQFIK